MPEPVIPNHPDYALLRNLASVFDKDVPEDTTDDQFDAGWAAMLAAIGADEKSVERVAFETASAVSKQIIRAIALGDKYLTLAALAALWCEGFVLGAQFRNATGGRDAHLAAQAEAAARAEGADNHV